MAHHEFRVMQNGIQVARCSGTDFMRAEQQILHYALQYREEGDVRVYRRVPTGHPDSKWRWKIHAFFDHVPKEMIE